MFPFTHGIIASSSAGTVAPSTDFIIRVKTDNAGTSASNQFTIPTFLGSYDYSIETSEHSLTGQTGSVTLTFSTAGEYVIRISGTFPRIYFNNGGDKDKLIYTYNYGDVGWTSFENAFFGCSNNVIDENCTGTFGAISFINAWRGNTSMTLFPELDLSSSTVFGGSSDRGAWRDCSSMTAFNTTLLGSGITFQGAWFGCSSLTSFPLADLSSGTIFYNAWYNCSSLTSFPIVDLSNGVGFYRAWYGCSGISDFPALNLSSATGAFSFRETWRNMGVLNSFATRNFYGMNDGANMFAGTTLPTADYSDILITQNANNPNNSVTLHGGNSNYNSSASSARSNLVSVKLWTITDAGLV